MGQTLPNGIYLPAEGERNCYDGLEGNWRSLDGLISTVAGKASATHAHGNISNDGKVGAAANLPLITGTGGVVQAGGFGNQANTFCEGNDSRLSDARTPVAHTHGKADVTDLLNSNFIPSANNSYDLGSSSYQWNNLYAKNYYYNGTAWGLDKANEWTQSQYIQGGNDKGWAVIHSEIEKGVVPSAAKSSFVWWADKNNTYLGRICSRVQADGTTILWLSSLNYYKNGALDPTGSSLTTSLILGVDASAYKFVQINADFRPDVNNGYNLGTSTAKWKSFNGINPGALSLPSGAAENINTDNWNFSWGANNVTAPFDGYISVACFGSALQINNETKSYAMTFAPGTDGYICGLLPVSSGDSIKVLVTRTQTSIYEGYKFIKASGNVS